MNVAFELTYTNTWAVPSNTVKFGFTIYVVSLTSTAEWNGIYYQPDKNCGWVQKVASSVFCGILVKVVCFVDWSKQSSRNWKKNKGQILSAIGTETNVLRWDFHKI